MLRVHYLINYMATDGDLLGLFITGDEHNVVAKVLTDCLSNITSLINDFREFHSKHTFTKMYYFINKFTKIIPYLIGRSFLHDLM